MERKHLVLMISAALVFVLGPVKPYAFSSEAEGDAANDRAASLNLEGEYDQAVASAKEAIAAYPDKGIYHSTLATAYYKLGQLDEAIASFNKAISLGYKEAAVYSVLGNAYYKSDRLKEAVAAYKKALELNPELTGARNNLASAEAELGGK